MDLYYIAFMYLIDCCPVSCTLTSLCAPTMKLGGRLISGTLVEVEKVTGEGRGLVMVRWCETLLLTWVQSSMVSMMPDGVDLNDTW